MPPELLPNVTTLPRPPGRGDVGKWQVTWKGVHFRQRGAWRIGIVRAWIRLRDGRWIAQIEHAQDGLHPEWPHIVFAVYDARLIVPIAPTPTGPGGPSARS